MEQLLKSQYLNIGGLGDMGTNFEQLITWMDWVTIIFSFITMILVIINFFKNKKQLEPVKIFISKDGKKEEIPSYILRKNFIRSDIKGILKELHDSKEDYRIKCLTQPDFLKKIFEIQQGKEDELIIEIDSNDFFKYEMKS